MRYSQSPTAQKYAKAYVQEYMDQLQVSDIEHIKLAINFFRDHHNFMSLVSLLSAQQLQRHELIDDIFKHFKLPQNLMKLVDLLVQHKKLILFASVLQDICCLYMNVKNMLEVTLYTATPLSLEQQQKFQDFFTMVSGKKIISSVVMDQALIAGIRMQSDLFLWEYSIAARIRLLSQQMLQEE